MSKAVKSSAPHGPRDLSAEVHSHFVQPPVRYPSVRRADDPELAEHALWNQEIADDLEAMDEEELDGLMEFAAYLRRLESDGLILWPDDGPA